jgi:C4-dicarboxylate-specific signal transduction histidine kinase
VNELLDGAAPGSLRLPEIMPTTLSVDWRQVRRWGIDEKAIPGDAVLHFKELTFLEQHRNEAMIAVVVFLLQSGLIAALVIERYRRRRAEQAMQRTRFELTHASRVAVAGELTASLAHEINQPLGAILSNADAAELILESGADRRDELRAILADIRRDDLRASEVIRRLRAFLANRQVERQPFELNEAVSDLGTLLRSESQRRRVTLSIQPAPTAVTMVGDRIQIQQVLINLVLNAMDAAADVPEDRRTVVVSVENAAGSIAIAVRDRGHGIPPEHLSKLFSSFFTTKQKGMGLGLSIARTLVEAHGGRIWSENGPGEGAVFQVEFPAANATSIPSEGQV